MSVRRRPSPALVVASFALAVALGGTSYAAVVLPAGSVGTKQLQNGAVVATKVKTHSLVAANFKPGQIPAGPAGPQGAQGLAGPAGLAGAAGPKGDPATKLFATVKQKAGPGGGVDLGPSSGVQSVTPGQAAGTYNLKFNQDVSHCAVIAIPGGVKTIQGEASAQTTGGSGVTVSTFDSDGSPDNLDFFTVAVFC
jgi:hypothetical protein